MILMKLKYAMPNTFLNVVLITEHCKFLEYIDFHCTRNEIKILYRLSNQLIRIIKGPNIFRFLSDEQNCQYILSNVTGMNNESNTDFFDSITRFGMGTGIIGFVVFAMSYIFVTCLNHAAENQVTFNVIKYLTLALFVKICYN